jgi:hypothetical protein
MYDNQFDDVGDRKNIIHAWCILQYYLLSLDNNQETKRLRGTPGQGRGGAAGRGRGGFVDRKGGKKFSAAKKW